MGGFGYLAWIGAVTWVAFGVEYGWTADRPGADISVGGVNLPSLNADPAETLSTSLRVAAREGRIKEVDKLLERGADVNGTSEFGQTALMMAALFNQVKAVDVLLRKGARADERDHQDKTALMIASSHCYPRVSRMLLDEDANVNLTDLQGKTALIYAAREGCAQIVGQLLMARGIDIRIKDDQGNSALDYALEGTLLEVGGPYTDTVRALTRAGAQPSKTLPQTVPQQVPRITRTPTQ